jgi:hypothetical protein
MIQRLTGLVFHHWQRKALSLLIACLIWLLVNHSIHNNRRPLRPAPTARLERVDEHWMLPQPVPIGLVMDQRSPLAVSWGAGTVEWGRRRVVAEPIRLQGCSHAFMEAVGPNLEFLVRLEGTTPQIELALRSRIEAEAHFLELMQSDGLPEHDAQLLEQFDREWRHLEARHLDGTALRIELQTRDSALELACL